NGYRTVTCDEIARLVIDRVSPGPRAVALTFDDGWASAWTAATPLLKQYGLRAILFAIPGRIVDAESLRSRAGDGPSFVTWPELKAMHQGGAWDIQSHTRLHAMIFCGAEIAGFVAPGYASDPPLERPLVSNDEFLDPDALGTPIYVRRSRMSNAMRFLPDESIADACREHVARRSDFFQRPTWHAELEAIVRKNADSYRIETNAAQEAAIKEELARGRELLNDKLATSSVRHVALPWGICGDVARRSLADTGHRTAFAERPFKQRGLTAGDDRFGLMRLNGKFLTCLPGHGRKWFMTTVSDR
ncbi:MAG TPA: polysaccharide deacetylase family protein, partial [Vicinamibacterales bacterium]|nr:polysaccharide deacetylase family protein [Vicinamibacterales bacterium]